MDASAVTNALKAMDLGSGSAAGSMRLRAAPLWLRISGSEIPWRSESDYLPAGTSAPAKSSSMARLNAGMSSGLRLVTRLPSTTTS